MANSTSKVLDDHLTRKSALSGFSMSGNVVSVSSPTLSAAELAELERVARATRHEVSLAAGVLKITPV